MAENSVRPETNAAAGILEEFSEYFDVPMRIAIEIGRRNMRVREILQLKPDSIVEISKAAGENLDVYINNRLIAFGEIIEMEGKAGIRLTDFVVQN
jgi:flagellar motor switch protein FliN/FliY